MNSTPLFAIILLASILGCSKPDVGKAYPDGDGAKEQSDPAQHIVGKWTYTANYFSSGGPGEWHNIVPADQSIEFKADGSFVSADGFLKGATRYEFTDSATIRFQPAPTTSGYILMDCSFKDAERELYLYPVNPMCIEGCSYKFRR